MHLLFTSAKPLVRGDGRLPEHPRRREQVVLEEGCLDPRHRERDGFDGGVGEAKGARKLYVPHVAHVLGEEGKALGQPRRAVWAEREQVRLVVRHLKRHDRAVTLQY